MKKKKTTKKKTNMKKKDKEESYLKYLIPFSVSLLAILIAIYIATLLHIY